MKRVTNSQAAIHESWLVRCSPLVPGFSRSNLHHLYDCYEQGSLIPFPSVKENVKEILQGVQQNRSPLSYLVGAECPGPSKTHD